jgi:ubiquinone/menaquinone biosynthesis C-methylase UbiE
LHREETVEAQLREAIEAYVCQPQPGANRTAEYNAMRVEARLAEEGDPSTARVVARIRDLKAPPGRVLEIGAGTGGLATAIARAGFEVDGVEPDPAGLLASQLRARRYPDAVLRFQDGRAEELPYPDESFDVVVSSQVLEHVPSMESAVRECFRVLKRGGACLHLMPNYAFPFEPHYRVPYPPRASKSLGRAYLKAIGRDTTLLDRDIFPTLPREVLRVFAAAGFEDVENRYTAEVAKKLSDVAEVRSPKLRRALGVLSRIGVLGAVRWAVLSTELYPSIVVVARRPS